MSVSPSAKQLHLIQKGLAHLHFYTGPIRSTLSVNVIKGIQRSLAARGYAGSVNGTIDAETQKYVQLVARRGGYKGPVNSNLDAASWAGYVKALRENHLTQAADDNSFFNTAVPTISGTPKVGSTLTATGGTYSTTGITNSYKWSKGGNQITGANTATYVPVSGDVGAALVVTVTTTKNGYTIVTSSAATAVVVA